MTPDKIDLHAMINEVIGISPVNAYVSVEITADRHARDRAIEYDITIYCDPHTNREVFSHHGTEWESMVETFTEWLESRQLLRTREPSEIELASVVGMILPVGGAA